MMMIRTATYLFLCVLALAVSGPAGASDAPVAPGAAVVSTSFSPEFEAAFRHAFDFARGLDPYATVASLQVCRKSGGTPHELEYGLSMSRNGPDHFALTVSRKADHTIVARLIASGRQGQSSIYLPREMAAVALTARIQDNPDVLALPMLFTLYDYLENTKFDRWLSMLESAECVGSEEVRGAPADHLKFVLNNYWSLRDYAVEMWLDKTDADKPYVVRLRLDLTQALRNRRLAGGASEDEGVVLDLSVDRWGTEGPPATDEFAPPGSPKEFKAVDMKNILMFANGQMPTAPSDMDLGSLTAGTASDALSRLKAATPAQRSQLMQKLRQSPGAAGAMSRARQMGVNSQDIERYRSLLEP